MANILEIINDWQGGKTGNLATLEESVSTEGTKILIENTSSPQKQSLSGNINISINVIFYVANFKPAS